MHLDEGRKAATKQLCSGRVMTDLLFIWAKVTSLDFLHILELEKLVTIWPVIQSYKLLPLLSRRIGTIMVKEVGRGVVSVPVSNNLLTLVFSISEVKPAPTIPSRKLNFEWGFHYISTKDEILLTLKALEWINR